MGKIKLYHNNSEIKTLKDFADYNQVVFDKEFTLNVLFDENKDLIFSQYSSRDKIRLAEKLKKEISNISVKDLKISDELPCPCYIIIDVKRVKYIIDTHKTEVQVPTNSVIAFQNEEINKILKDPEATYKQARRIRSGVKVLGWFKSLYSLKHSKNSNGDIGDFYNSDVNFIDLSPIVVNLNTSVNSQGGSFSITFLIYLFTLRLIQHLLLYLQILQLAFRIILQMEIMICSLRIELLLNGLKRMKF